MDRLLKLYSIAFLTVLCLFFLAIGIISKGTGNPLQFSQLPWSGDSLATWLILLSLVGLAAVALGARGKLRWLLALFALYVFAQTVWGFYFGPHRFEGYDDFRWSLWFSLAALAAMAGAVRAALVRV